MNLRQLETFRAIMVTGSTQAAARMLNVSQPAVSRMLSHTESALGVELFARNKGRLAPTDEARALYREIEPLFLAVEAAESRIKDIREGRTGYVRVVSTPSMANTIVARGLTGLREQSPDIRISLDVRRWESLVTQLEANTADVGFVLTDNDRPQIESRPLATGEMICIMPHAHPLAQRDTITPEDLPGQPLVRLTPATPLGDILTRGLGPVADDLTTILETRYCNTVCSLVQSGMGIGVVDEFVMSTHVFPGIVARPLAPRIPVTAHAVLSRNRTPSRLTTRLIRAVSKLMESRKSVADLIDDPA